MLVSQKEFSVLNGKCVIDGEYVKTASNDFYCEKIKIEANGHISVEEKYHSFDELISESEMLEQAEKVSKQKYNLYNTNSTWKLEVLEGNPLYDERYYNLFRSYSQNDCIALSNEDNQILLASRNGKIYINYGVIDILDDGSTMQMKCGDSVKSLNEIFEGRDSIIIPVPSTTSGFYDIYYFKEK